MEELFEKAGFALGHGQIRESIELLNQILAQEAVSENEELIQIRAMDLLARAKWFLGERDKAMNIWQQAALKARKFQDGQGAFLEIAILCNLSHSCLENGNFGEAREIALNAVEAARKMPKQKALPFSLFTLSAAYYRLHELKNAEDCALEALALWEKSGNTEKAATCMNNLGRIYEELGDNEKGIMWHKRAVEARRLLPEKEDLAFSLGNLGVALASQGEWLEAEAALSEAVEIYASLGKQDSHECQGYARNRDIARAALQNGSRA